MLFAFSAAVGPPVLPAPTRRRFFTVLALTSLTLAGSLPILAADSPEARLNELSAAEKADGWRLLFDGRTTQGWKSFKKETFPEKGWVVEDGCLKHVARAGGGDIVTAGTYAEFELQWEWSLAAKANSGLKYFVSPDRGGAIGHEYQLLDPPKSEPGKGATGGFYDVLPPTTIPAIRSAPAFNHSRIVVQGDLVEHWLNGVKTLSYTLGSEEVKAAVAASKFKSVAGFGTRVRGHILLQDHGGEVRFRNLKIRDLAKAP